jgi:hypothetical protein
MDVEQRRELLPVTQEGHINCLTSTTYLLHQAESLMHY